MPFLKKIVLCDTTLFFPATNSLQNEPPFFFRTSRTSIILGCKTSGQTFLISVSPNADPYLKPKKEKSPQICSHLSVFRAGAHIRRPTDLHNMGCPKITSSLLPAGPSSRSANLSLSFGGPSRVPSPTFRSGLPPRSLCAAVPPCQLAASLVLRRRASLPACRLARSAPPFRA